MKYAVMIGSNCIVVSARNKKEAYERLRTKYKVKLKDVYRY